MLNSFNTWKSICISYLTPDNGTREAVEKVPVDFITQSI